MFDTLSDRLEGVFKKLRGHGRISESNIDEALREVRLALLEADVNIKVVRDFVEHVKKKALGQEVLRSLTPEQHLLRFVADELRIAIEDSLRDLRGAFERSRIKRRCDTVEFGIRSIQQNDPEIRKKAREKFGKR